MKQAQIESFICKNKIDILNLQEVDLDKESFSACPVISSSFQVISNNSQNKYGTAILVKSELPVTNVQFDSHGRVIVLDVCGITVMNCYLASGSHPKARASREEYCSTLLPQLLLNRCDSGIVGGDWNCVTERRDVSHNPAGKVSPSLVRMLKSFSLRDVYRDLHPAGTARSRYYNTEAQGPGYSRIDRCYKWGEGLSEKQAEYLPVPFSDQCPMS